MPLHLAQARHPLEIEVLSALLLHGPGIIAVQSTPRALRRRAVWHLPAPRIACDWRDGLRSARERAGNPLAVGVIHRQRKHAGQA